MRGQYQHTPAPETRQTREEFPRARPPAPNGGGEPHTTCEGCSSIKKMAGEIVPGVASTAAALITRSCRGPSCRGGCGGRGLVVGGGDVVAEAREPALYAGQVVVLRARLVADARGAGLERGEARVVAEAAVVGARVGRRCRGRHAGAVHIVQRAAVGGTRGERRNGEECRLCGEFVSLPVRLSGCCSSGKHLPILLEALSSDEMQGSNAGQTVSRTKLRKGPAV